MKKAGLQVPRILASHRKSIVRVIIVVVSLFMSIGLARSAYEHWKKLDVVGERQKALEKATREHEALIERLKEATSAAFVEREARDKLGLVREGDTVVLMPNDQLQTPNEGSQQEALSNWQRWWRLFF